jgi:tRNA A-37 threonylcarbamoyl transferase component Bud32
MHLRAPLEQVSAGGFRWHVTPRFRDLLLGPAGLRLDEWLRAGQAHIVKQGPHRIVYHVQLAGLSFYVKRNLLIDRAGWLRQLIRPSKARTEYERARGVAERGLPTYVPLAFGEEQAFLGAGESIIVTEALTRTHELNVFAVDFLAALPAPRQARLRQRLAFELGKFLARLHEAGVRHDDIHPGNILVRLEPHDRLALFLIDLNAVHLGETLTWKESQENLVVLNRWFVLRASRGDRCRFWNAYRQERNLAGARTGQRLAGEIETRTLLSNLEFCVGRASWDTPSPTWTAPSWSC